MNINRVMISGRLTRDAELRTTPSGTSILNFSVAVNERRRNANGEWEDYANFIDCTMFPRRAERAEMLKQYLAKGVKVAVEGRLHYSSWEDRNTGQKKSKLGVTVDELEFMSSRNDGGQNYDAGNGYGGGNYGGQNAGGNYGGQSYQQPQGNAVPEPPTPSAYGDEDIPF